MEMRFDLKQLYQKPIQHSLPKVLKIRVNYKNRPLCMSLIANCVLYLLIITENVLDVCKPLQVMSFSPNSVNFLWLHLTKWTPT
ncbi:hypothetical protein Hanom_Chr05g00388691 [Helianthus anomalus]